MQSNIKLINIICPNFQALNLDADNAYALVQMGHILFNADRNYVGSIPYLQKGITSDDDRVHHTKFYHALGDSYYRTGNHDAVKLFNFKFSYLLF